MIFYPFPTVLLLLLFLIFYVFNLVGLLTDTVTEN